MQFIYLSKTLYNENNNRIIAYSEDSENNESDSDSDDSECSFDVNSKSVVLEQVKLCGYN